MSKKQKDILYKAIELFNEFGYSSVGIDRIIAESKVAKMTFYKYFPSKDFLITECLKERDQLIRESILLSLEPISKENGFERLKGIFDWFNHWFNQDNFHGCMFIKALDELPYNTNSRNISILHKEWTVSLLQEVLQSMGLENHQQLAFQMRMLLDGAIIHEKMFKDQRAISAVWALVLQMIKA
ncbi:TetR/AcrR family transcriptional regulator [Acinetobacter apis]|uniref:Transcriptional regulator, TetR family n=1 Tax=Acinetobacter apis TaxID=1229165 RepID=A0A217EH17_9GAMM|nr:TetR/AcrR family transcriptional regulator [Acinetobacter apis]SNQ29634.1 transcriptional regulator, TetR family [Acinetobacter apis]